jgi:23S rRNA pseudouridine1911/1915/1917 synthase
VTDRFVYTVDDDESGIRVDIVTANRIPDVSRSMVQAMARAGNVRVDSQIVKPSNKVAAGQRVEVDGIMPALSAPPEQISLDIVYQDADLAVVDKPAGMVVHPAPGHGSGTLANALTALFPQTASVGSIERPGIVHRLDKDTSGLLVVALNPVAHRSLQRQIASRTAKREYIALAAGQVQPQSGTIEAPIGRDPTDRKHMAVLVSALVPPPRSIPFAAAFLISPYSNFNWVPAELTRFGCISLPLATRSPATPCTGPAVPGLTRQFLHATRLALDSPTSGLRLTFTSPPDRPRLRSAKLSDL